MWRTLFPGSSNEFCVCFSFVDIITNFRLAGLVLFHATLPLSFGHEQTKENNWNKGEPHGTGQAENVSEFLDQELADEVRHGRAQSKG